MEARDSRTPSAQPSKPLPRIFADRRRIALRPYAVDRPNQLQGHRTCSPEVLGGMDAGTMHPGELVGGDSPVERRTLAAGARDDLHQPAAIEFGDLLGTDARCAGTVRCSEVLDGGEQLTHAGSAVPSKPPGAVWDRNRRRALILYRRPGEQVLHARDRGPGPSGGLLQVSRPGARFGERLRRGIVSSSR